MIPYVEFLREDEQVLIEGLTKRWTVNGPGVVTIPAFHMGRRRKAAVLGPTDYLHIRNTLTGELRSEFGPKLFFPTASEVVVKALSAIPLKKNRFIRLMDQRTGVVRVERGEATVYLSPTEEILEDVREGFNVDEHKYVVVRDTVTGQLDTITTPQVFIPAPNQQVVEVRKRIALKANQYVRLLDKRTGAIRVERGEQSMALGPTEEVLEDVKEGLNIDEQTAVLVRDITTGQLQLVTTPQVFIPMPNQEVVEPRKRIVLEDHQAVVIKDKAGNYTLRRGTDTERAFFLQPHTQLVQFAWSTGVHKDQRTLKLTHLDMRPKFMWYEFEARTQDNVELVIGITFFWQLANVEAMIWTTDDAPGDLCSHARSVIIQSVSQVTLEKFLAAFNTIVREAVVEAHDRFYSDRGVQLHSVEVRSIACKDAATQKILQEMIQETTNRLNRLQKQESENEVKLQQMRGDIEAEQLRGQLLDLRQAHVRAEAVMHGQAEAEKVRAFLDGLGELPAESKLAVFNTLRKQDVLEKLSTGSAQLYFTPADVDLSIEARNGHGMTKR